MPTQADDVMTDGDRCVVGRPPFGVFGARGVPMHEMSLIRPVVDLVLAECDGKDVGSVRAVHLSVGELRDVIEDYMEGLFRHLARGTVAENASLVIKRIPTVVICEECGTPFKLDVRDSKSRECPHCHAYQRYHLYSGNEFRVDRIEVEGAAGERALAGEVTAV